MPTQRGTLKKDDNGVACGWTYLNIVLAAPTTTAVTTTVVTVYDSLAASGTVIATITVPASPMPVTLTYDAAFNTGLTIVTATAASDITVSYI